MIPIKIPSGIHFISSMCTSFLVTARNFFYLSSARGERIENNVKYGSWETQWKKLYDCENGKNSTEFMETKINISQLIYFVREFIIGSYVIIRWGLKEMCIKSVRRMICSPGCFTAISKAFPFPLRKEKLFSCCSWVVNVFFEGNLFLM